MQCDFCCKLRAEKDLMQVKFEQQPFAESRTTKAKNEYRNIQKKPKKSKKVAKRTKK